MSGLVLEFWLGRRLGADEDIGPRFSETDVLAVHNASTINPRTVHQQQGNLIYSVGHAAPATSLNRLSETPRPSEPDNPLGGQETRALATARHSSPSGAGPATCLRARPTDSLHVVPASEFVGQTFNGTDCDLSQPLRHTQHRPMLVGR